MSSANGSGELDHGELVIGQLAGENGDCGRGLTVGGMEIKCAERHPGLHVEPEEAAAAEIGAAVAGDGDKTAVADQDGLLCAVEDGIDSVRERHVAAIVVFSAGDGLLHQVVEALVFEKGFGGLVSIVLKERELIDGDEGLKVGWRRRAGGGRSGWASGGGAGGGTDWANARVDDATRSAMHRESIGFVGIIFLEASQTI